MGYWREFFEGTDNLPGVNAFVSKEGKIFTIIDEWGHIEEYTLVQIEDEGKVITTFEAVFILGENGIYEKMPCIEGKPAKKSFWQKLWRKK